MKILYITNLFGIKGSSAAIRNSALIKGLVQNGHEVDVLTIKHNSSSISDILINCGCNRIFESRLSIIEFVNKSALIQEKLNNGFLRVCKKFIRELIFFPDLIKKWPQIVDARNFSEYDVIISSSDYKSSHIVAEKIKDIYKSVRWIQIWGDPWSLDSSITKFTRLRAKSREKLLLKKADKIIYVSRITYQAMTSLFPNFLHKMYYIPRSYYEEVVVNKKVGNKNYNIMYAGNITPGRNFEKFLSDVDNYNIVNDRHFVIHFYGNYLQKTKERLSSYACVKIHQSVDYGEILRIYADMDMLLFISNDKLSTQIPGKLFDYFGTTLPIICLVSENKEILNFIVENEQCIIYNNLYDVVMQMNNKTFRINKDYSPQNIAFQVLK